MSEDSTYCYKESDDFLIENGILKGTEVPYTSEHNSYGELILERLRARPDFVGQVDGYTGREETFGEMAEKSVKCAMWLKKHDIKPGDIVAICTHLHMDTYVPAFAAMYIGVVFNAWWDVGLTKDLTRHFLNLTKPKILFANEASAVMANDVAKEIGLDMKIVILGKLLGYQSLDNILSTQDIKLVSQFQCTNLPSLDNPAVLIYTSGTTGSPKGALHSHRSLFGNLSLASKLGSVQSNIITTMIFSSLSWVTGLLFMLRGVVAGERRVIYPEFTEESTFQLIEKFNVNWMLLGPSAAVRLQKSPSIANYNLSSLQFLFLGGAVLKDELQKTLAETLPQTTIFQAYGATELGGMGLQQTAGFKPGSCGRIVKNIQMKVVDPDTGKILGPNETGEACFKSPFMLSGYYKNPVATSETVDCEGWLHTGDLVHYDEEGHVFVTDRIKELIKYRGHHVSPAMVEQVLLSHPGVWEVAVLAIPNDMDDEHPVAFVAKTLNSKVTEEELQKLVEDTLPDYMRLRGGVVFLDQLPHTSSGKVARTDLRKLAKSYSK